ncbi:MAG: urea ABC transporter substrate-binding protein [Planctomycetota bacterium]|nr:urea ABC transporter substrate-binding protein [Planctomycetota bacterium]
MSIGLNVSRLTILIILLLGVACDRASEPSETAAAEPIKIGILHSKTGTLAISEKAVIDATILAVEDVNEQGGVLGRPLKPIVVDGSSDEAIFAREATRLLDTEGVSVIFGCWTSASRKAVRPIIEARNGLLFYPVQYEGLEQSPNIVYLGSAPNQQILPAVDWAMEELDAKRFLLVGSDYVFPRAANAIITDHVEALGGEIVGEYYVGLGSRNVEHLIEAVQFTQPDVILNTINGDTNIAFFSGLRKGGVTPEDTPTISFSIGEPELRSMSSSEVAGDYAAWNYFQSIPGPDNLAFVRKFGQRYHPRRVLSDPMQSAWNAVHLWAQAAEKAGSINPSKVRAALGETQYNAPEGMVRIDGNTQHLWMRTRIGRITPARFFDIVWESEDAMRPMPYPESRDRKEWDAFLQDLYTSWGNRWSNPEAK